MMKGTYFMFAVAWCFQTSVHSSLHKEKDNHFSLADPDGGFQLEPINGTQNFRIAKKSKENKSWYDGREMTLIHCVRKAKCEPLKTNTCLGSKLTYSRTSIHLTYSYSQDQVYEKLQQYVALKNIPKCWAVVQLFVCATFMPRCEEIKGEDMVFLPSLEMCRMIIEPCKLVYNTSIFPEFLKCNASLFPSECDNDVREMKFNTTGQCLAPLVHTDMPLHFYEGMSGCGLPCRDPLYTEDEHNQIRRLVLWGASLAFALNLFTVATFLVDWRSSSKYPALVIFYINVCYMISSIGWLAQFLFDSRGDIVCSKDKTMRRGEPSAGENLSCVIIFVLVYYFLMAACVWFVIFTYAWHMSFKALGKIQERIDKKGAYFHLVAWSLPLVLTITIMALGEIDGSSIVGICFVGYLNHAIRAGFLLGPISAVLLIGGYFLSRGLLTLISVQTSSKDILSARASSKIRNSIMRCGVTAVLTLLFIGATFFYHIYEYLNHKDWYDSFRMYLVCRLTAMYRGTEPNECVQAQRPSVAMLQLQLLCLFCSAGVMASWTWTGSTVDTWKRYIRRKCGCEVEEPVKLQKHKLIAQAFARRKEFHDQGRMSISFHNTHTDPVGLNFELNSVASHDFSSTWANNLPRFVKRRGALTGAQHSHSQSSNAPRRNSQDSQISFSLRHVSVESRRNSLDSQLSVKIAEMKTKVASRRRMKPISKSSRRRHTRNNTIYTRKESTTSVESQIGTHILSAMSSTKERHNITNNRRTGNAGLSPEQLELLLDGKMILPFLQNQGLTTTSDEENGSMASFKIRDSKVNIVLRKKDLNLSTDDIAETNLMGVSHRREYQTDSESEACNKQLARIKDSSHLDSKSSEEFRVDKYSGHKEALKDLRGSKSSSKSKSSRRSSRQSGRIKVKRPIKNTKSNKYKEEAIKLSTFKRKHTHLNADSVISSNCKNSLGSSFDSYCSELGPLALHSSFSGVSVEKNNSRNSKRSCDVGIQANSHEIATHTMSSNEVELNINNKINSLKKSHNSHLSYNRSDKSINLGIEKKEKKDSKKKSSIGRDSEKRDLETVKYYHSSEKVLGSKSRSKQAKHDDSDENLLIHKNNDRPIVIRKRNDASCNLSESKKLKQLLLP